MLTQAKYVQNSINVVFPREPQIRRLANEFEDMLKGKYFQPQIVPVPDEFDPEVPRMIFGSLHGFSQIIVTQVNFVLNAIYSPDWQEDISKGNEYLLERVSILFQLLGLLKDVKPSFCGLTTRVNMPTNAGDEAILHQLSRIFLNPEEVQNYHDLEIKFATIVQDKFFNNMTIQNYRAWTRVGPQEGIPRLAREVADERGIQVIGDFNDRYAFNEIKGYVSSSNVAKEVINYGLIEVRKIVDKIGGAFNDGDN